MSANEIKNLVHAMVCVVPVDPDTGEPVYRVTQSVGVKNVYQLSANQFLVELEQPATMRFNPADTTVPQNWWSDVQIIPSGIFGSDANLIVSASVIPQDTPLAAEDQWLRGCIGVVVLDAETREPADLCFFQLLVVRYPTNGTEYAPKALVGPSPSTPP